MCTEKNLVITCTGPNFPALVRGIMRDASIIWNTDEMYKRLITQPNRNGCRCESTGSMLEFCTFADVERAKGSKRDILFVNEITAVPEEIAWELMVRTRKNVVVDFNPSNYFYIHDKFLGKSNATWIYSTHKANKHIPESIHEELEALKDTDPYRYRVYCLGMTGIIQGTVYTNWRLCGMIPEDYEWRVYGLDWGWSSDATALVEVTYSGGELYLRELLYQTGLTNQDIALKIKEFGIKDELIICDSAELKSVEELRRGDIVRATPAVKGPGSIMNGISKMQSFRLNLFEGSANLRNEIINYKWKTDNLGKSVNVPIDKFNHCLDATRYCVSYMFEKPKARTYLGRM